MKYLHMVDGDNVENRYKLSIICEKAETETGLWCWGCDCFVVIPTEPKVPTDFPADKLVLVPVCQDCASKLNEQHQIKPVGHG